MAPLDDETTKKVIRQVEFYFSDSNLPRDKFLMKTISESDDGMVSLALICSFSRMRGHLGLGDVKPEDVPEETIQAVAKTLKTSTFLKISEDCGKVGRVTKLAKPEEVIKQSDDRTVAASPLQYDVNLEDVETFFSQHATVNSVRLPRHVADNRLFCGTALVEFSTVEDAVHVLKQTLSYSGVELELKPKEEFDAERAKQEEEAAKTRPQDSSNRKEKTNLEPEYPKGLLVAFTLKSLFAEDSTKQNGELKQTSDDLDDAHQEKDDSEETGKEVSEDVKDTANPVENAEKGEEKETESNGAETEAVECEDTEKSTDIPNEKEDLGSCKERPNIAACKDNKDVVLREDLKSIFQKFGTVKFIDFKIGDVSGYIRFEDAEAVQKAQEAAANTEKGGLVVKNFIAVIDALTGDAEKEYWDALRSGQQDKHRDFKNNRGRGGGRHNRGGGRNSGWKHSRGRDNDRPNRANKVQKVEAA